MDCMGNMDKTSGDEVSTEGKLLGEGEGHNIILEPQFKPLIFEFQLLKTGYIQI